MKKILVVCYSRSGFTHSLAKRIAAAAGADLEVIEDTTARDGVGGYLQSAVEAALHLQPNILAAKCPPANYDLVVIGTPIWMWNMASPVRAYIARYRHQFKELAFFCTYGGSGQFKVLKDLTKLAGRPTIATLALAEKTIAEDHFRKPLARFVAQIRSTGVTSGIVRRRGGMAGSKDRLVVGSVLGGR